MTYFMLPGMTAKETIRALGGSKALAEILGLTHAAVRNWSAIGFFPPRLYLTISKLANERKVYLDETLFRERSNGKAAAE